jgi:TPR repeat protein
LLTAQAGLRPIWRFPVKRVVLWTIVGFVLLVVGLTIWRIATEPPGRLARFQAKYYAEECAKGDGQSCANLGFALATGEGVARDDVQAIAMYRKSCELGSGLGCLNLGNRYRDGRGVPRDLVVARRHLDQACKVDQADACDGLARVVLEQNGPDARAQARRLFERACTLGNGWGCRAGRDLGSGVNNPEAEKRTFRALKDACEQGSQPRCLDLGLAYRVGVGVAPDPAASARIIRAACDKGYEPACRWTAGTSPPR